MKLPTCTACRKPIRPGEPAFHRSGVPVLHQKHYSQGYTPLQRGRWSELIVATRELAEGSGGLAASLTQRPGGMVRRGTKPGLEEAERLQYEREELHRREGR